MSLAAHFPALQVVVPLLAAPLAVLLRNRHAAFAAVLAASWIAFGISLALWAEVQAAGTISYAVGSWEPPWGIELRVDRLSTILLTLVSGAAALVLPYSRASIESEIPREQHYLFYAMLALCLAGLLGIAITGDAFNLFVFLEIASLSTYVLIALGRHRRALMAAYRYLIMGTIGATFVVIGVGLLYLQTGTLNLVDMGERLAAVEHHRPVLIALGFLTVGISLKLALFPLHQWLPDAYTYAPSAVTAFLAATATKVSIYALLRFYYSVFDEAQAFSDVEMGRVLLVLALAAMIVASAVAVFQDNVKRLLAWSSLSQIGYIILGLSFDSVAGVTATLVHILNHALAKGGAFLLLGGAVLAMGGATLASLSGMGRALPFTTFGLVVCGLSLIGVPGTAGFISKWYLVLAALEKGEWWLVFMIVFSSFIAVAYVWRFVEAAYFREPAWARTGREMPLEMAIPAWTLVAATVYAGFDTRATAGAAAEAAAMLLGAGR